MVTRGLFDDPEDLITEKATTKETVVTEKVEKENDDPFGLPPLPEEDIPMANAPPEYSVSEISQKLKNMVEDTFSFVRIRGEISRVTVAKSGHMYTSLKDDTSVLDAICWRGTVERLGLKVEEGMEVVCTGRLTTYPGRSNYQLIIETMELAGQGALLKMLEDRKKKLAAEGLFDAARKKPIPYLPKIIGVITSPTGAVIRDIMHRLDERFPRHVLIWPVMVQGQGAAKTITDALNGFNIIPLDHPNRPDVVIIARGGGSLEDLMPFNDEGLVRAVAHSMIPVISAVGHETDTTLIDYAADLRAPTPTAAAEKAVPVRADIMAQLMDAEKRLFTTFMQKMKHDKVHLLSLARGLTDPKHIMDTILQKMDHLNMQLDQGLQKWLDRRHTHVKALSGYLSPHHLIQNLKHQKGNVQKLTDRLIETPRKTLMDKEKQLQNQSALLESLSFKRVLDRGYSVILDASGHIISSAKTAEEVKDLRIQFKDGETKVITTK